MDRYQRVEKPKPETPIGENDIRITAQGQIRNYINYATSLLQDKRVKEIVLKAMGQAISKTVVIAEILKKNIRGLHQNTAISSTSITDVWEPIEEGLVPLEMTRHVSMISITLSMRDLNKDSPGYQSPAYVEQPRQQRQYYQRQQQQQQQHFVKQAIIPAEDSYGRGRGRGRNAGFRGGYGVYRGGYGSGFVGGYNGGYDDGYNGYNGVYAHNQENGGWNYNWGGGGRGRGGFRGARYDRVRGGARGYESGGRGYEGGGRGYDKRGGRGYENGGRGYDGGARGYENGGQGYDGEARGYENGGRGYDGGRGYEAERGYNRGRGRMGNTGRGRQAY